MAIAAGLASALLRAACGLVALAAAREAAWHDLEEDAACLVQTQYAVFRPQESLLSVLHIPAEVVAEVLDDDPEVGLGKLEKIHGLDFYNRYNRSGHIHKMANHERWIGWSHFSNSHPNGTLVNAHLVQDGGLNFFASAPPREWAILAIVCFVLCLVDGLVLRRAPDTFKAHMGIILIWFIIAGLYLWGVWARMGRHRGVEWISGYILEWMLSMDNLFIFHLVFQSYKTPQEQIHKAVFVGIIGAVVMRMVFFLVVSTLLHAVGWFRWPFGAMLVWSAIEAVRGEEEDDGDLKDTRLVRGLKWMFGKAIKDGYDTEGTAIFIWNRKEGRVQLSLLFVVIVIVEFSDIIFALDSVSAKVAQIPNQYIAFSSSVMAMYGLRAMFFIVQDLVEMFDLLKYGLGVILCFIGVELMFAHWIHMPSGVECILIVAIFVVCIIASHIKSHFWPEPESEAEEATEGKEGQEKEKEEEKAPNPLDGLSQRPEGEQVEQDDKKAWTIQEGATTTYCDDEKDSISTHRRSKSESDLKQDADKKDKA